LEEIVVDKIDYNRYNNPVVEVEEVDNLDSFGDTSSAAAVVHVQMGYLTAVDLVCAIRLPFFKYPSSKIDLIFFL
jgi:hypothetical protein